MPSRRRGYVKSLCAIVVMLLVAACVRATEIAPTKQPINTKSTNGATQTDRFIDASSTAIRSDTTPSPLPRTTQTATPTALFWTTPEASWTPIPTLLPGQSLNELFRLWENNGECQLPCWWGLTPGQSHWYEAREILSRISTEQGPFKRGEPLVYDYSFSIPEDLDPLFPYIEPNIWVEGTIVKIIQTNGKWVRRDFDFSLSGFLSQLGQPDQIWLNIITETQFWPRFEMSLFYSQKGIMIDSNGELVYQGTDGFICPYDFHFGKFPAALALFKPEKENSFESIIRQISGEKPVGFNLIEDASVNFDETTFYNTYKDKNNKYCFQIKN